MPGVWARWTGYQEAVTVELHQAKSELRKTMRRLRGTLPVDQRVQETRAVWERVLQLVDDGPVFVYLGVRSELATDGLIRRLLERGEVAIPRITGDRRMVAARYEEPLVPGPRGIPTTLGPEIEVGTAILPGLAFDGQGGRLGYGGAFYDSWIAAHPGVRTVGIGFSSQLVEQVPREAHDRLLDEVLCGP